MFPLVLAAACAAPLSAVQRGDASPMAAVHVVQAGETAWRISRRYGMTVEELAEANDLDDVTKLSVGAKLRVRGAPASPEVAATESTPKVTSSKDYPLRWPVEGKITGKFGARAGQGHDGIDIGAPKGTKVQAAAAGKVLFSARHEGYGNLVVLRHDDGLVTVYAHHEENLVRKGQHVAAGQVIAKVGQTGRASGPHLHFEVRKGAVPENPLRFLPP